MIRVVHSGFRIRILTFYPSRIPDRGVKKAPDPGSGSATLNAQILAMLGSTEKNTVHCSSQHLGCKFLEFLH